MLSNLKTLRFKTYWNKITQCKQVIEAKPPEFDQRYSCP